MPASLSGLSVLTPAAGWALLALAIPLLIHLFSRSRGRLVRIGHIDLVRQARRLQVTELKLTQWLLLLLRLGIFTLAALILAGLATAGLNSSSAPTIYLAPGWLHSSSRADVDALLNTVEKDSGSRIFLLQPGFPQADRQALETGRQPSFPDTGDFNTTWLLLAERLSLERHFGDVTVYATDYSLQFGSDRPTLPRDVNWRTSHPQQVPVPDQRPIRVLIAYDQDRVAALPVFNAALAALREHRLPGLSWESIGSARLGEANLKTDWLIRLGNGKPDPEQLALIDSPTVVLSDAGDGGIEETTQFVDLPFYPFSRFRLDRFSRHEADKTGADGLIEGQVLLSTADGSPLLQEFHAGRTRILQFNSRFDPRWSSLSEQIEFPELLLQLMSDPGQDTHRFADARINPADLQTDRINSAADTPLPRRSVQGLLAILLVLLWITERWLSERNAREKR